MPAAADDISRSVMVENPPVTELDPPADVPVAPEQLESKDDWRLGVGQSESKDDLRFGDLWVRGEFCWEGNRSAVFWGVP